ncbi:TssQ family T6SS-associated lipoprotein [Undibacterium sp. TC9W]|uniref:TssQ family T6SS-associated lipoprotein n=1 Tax=Undibacterium sp. TC9W TaxID=3413053 RepID=UPI003BEFA99C
MNKLAQTLSVAGLMVACVLLQGCETAPKQAPAPKPVVKPKEPPPPPPPPPVEPTVPALSPDVQALKDGTALYDGGDYNGAIKKLGGNEIWSGHNKDVQLGALKIMAFSYCVTSRTQLCRQQFDKALKLDPTFNLSAAEIGHPVWGPVFLKSRNAVKAPAPAKKKESTAVSK